MLFAGDSSDTGSNGERGEGRPAEDYLEVSLVLFFQRCSKLGGSLSTWEEGKEISWLWGRI